MGSSSWRNQAEGNINIKKKTVKRWTIQVFLQTSKIHFSDVGFVTSTEFSFLICSIFSFYLLLEWTLCEDRF